LREPEQRPCPQAVGERGRDEISEKGAAHQLQMTTTYRVCFRKFFAAQIPHLPQLTVYEQRLFKKPQKEIF
jgi:hypothetical protein